MLKDEKAIATFTIHEASRMTREGRAEIAAWLRSTAKSLTRDGDKYAKRFTARYMARVVVLAALLSGCSTLGAIVEMLPETTPQERCEANGGKWVRAFDKDGHVSGGQCVDAR